MRPAAAPTPGAALVLSPIAGRRLSNQIGRAFRGTYGAETGLLTIVRPVAWQLLAAGASPTAVVEAMSECVLRHPERTPDVGRSATSGARPAVLVELIRECVASVAVELERAS